MKASPDRHDEALQQAERIAYLIAGHIRNTLTAAERAELDEWVVASDENLALFERLTDEDEIQIAMHRYLKAEGEKEAVLQGIKERMNLTRRKRWRPGPYIIAASLILLAVSLYLLVPHRPQEIPEKPVVQSTDLPPGTDKAVLTLSDGRTIILDRGRAGKLAQDGSVAVHTLNGNEISYKGGGSANGLHTLSTPRGGQYAVVLGDGTKVWLNAESSLRYPVQFSGASREVVLSGEGYFEVARNAAMPFVVCMEGDRSITVLGTRFNVQAYAGEAVTATLLEGKVRVVNGRATEVLAPGEVAQLDGGVKKEKKDTAAAVAWKEGKFLFRDATIREIGEQIERWYDIEVEYKGTIDEHFTTETGRSIPLSRLLAALEGTGEVHFRLEGRRLMIQP